MLTEIGTQWTKWFLAVGGIFNGRYMFQGESTWLGSRGDQKLVAWGIAQWTSFLCQPGYSDGHDYSDDDCDNDDGNVDGDDGVNHDLQGPVGDGVGGGMGGGEEGGPTGPVTVRKLLFRDGNLFAGDEAGSLCRSAPC